MKDTLRIVIRAGSATDLRVPPRRVISLMLALTALGCRESAAPDKPRPASLEVVGNPIAGTTVGTLAGNLTVRVKDATGGPVSGVVVSFTISLGSGHVTPAADTSKADGSVSAALTVGTVPGQNQVTATVSGVLPAKSLTVIGVAGPIRRIAITPRRLRFLATRNSDNAAATARDSFGNNTGSSVTWLARNPSLVGITPGTGNNIAVQVASRPGQTYLVATAAGVSDSILVSTLDASSSPCLFAADPNTLAVGGSVLADNSGVACIRATDAGAEYALVANYGTPASTVFVQMEALGSGVGAPAPSIGAAPSRGERATHDESESRDVAFESQLRLRERTEIGTYVHAARSWFASRGAAIALSAREGDLASVNVNAFEFCSDPVLRTARIAAITNSAVILSDTSNPAGGFTDAEYRAIGIAMDTLVNPVDTTAFGAPTDIDGNGRVTILFTRAVNELTPRGSGGIALGFFYARDLLPKESAIGSCPGSNVREMFYVLVPDPEGEVGDPRSKTFVQNVTVSTIAHEYQHLINSSRRLYVNKTASASEEVWLNEGLSHIAEELVFYRASGLGPRQNIGASQLQPGSETRAAFDTFLRGNFGRYHAYLRAPEVNSPIASDDLVTTRGATWAFLRYVADHAGQTDGDLWRRLVNSQLTGVSNIEAALQGTGLTMLGTLRDWSMSVYADDNLSGGNAAFQQPSWDFITGMPAVGLTFGLTPVALTNGVLRAFPLRAAGSSYMRFSVPQNQEALIQVTGASGTTIPPGVRLMLVRTR